MLTGKNYIGGELKAGGTITFRTINPLKNEENTTLFTEASAEEVNEAVTLANQAFWQYKSVSNAQKAIFLDTIADEMEELGDTLIELYCKESGLPDARARGERGRTLGQLRAFAELLREGSWVEARIDTAIPDRVPAPKPDLRKMNVGIGPIVVFGASNFPLAYSTAGGDTASALAAGCPVIVKSHPMHAGTSELVASAVVEAAQKTGMPNGVFSHLNSSGIEVGKQLVVHPMVKGVGFTGSIKGGRALYDMAAQRKEPIPVFAEMGSINPVVMLPAYLEDNAEEAAATYASSITLGAGQFCTNPGLILAIESEQLSVFKTKLVEALIQISPSCMLHPTIAANYSKGKQELTQQPGVSLLGSFDGELDPNFTQQMVATVDGAAFLKNPALHQEVFGPFSLVVQCKDLSELREILHQLEGQLTGTILATKEELVENRVIVEALKDRVGRIIFNGVPTGVEVCPSMLHGGPYPASTDARFTAVGTDSIKRWVRPVAFQSWPDELLPLELQNENLLGILRKVNNVETKAAIQ